MTPIMKRRLQNFRANSRGYWSLWIFLALFAFCLPAEFVANDKPLVVNYNGEYYFPVINSYPETEFGGIFKAEADYKDEAVQKLIEDNGWILWPLIPYSYDTFDYYATVPSPDGPSASHWLGTDDAGRDVLARVIYGFRISVLFGLALTIISSIVGVTVGLIQGFYGGWIDLVGQRIIEVWTGLPSLFILIILASMVEPNFWWLLGVLALFSWPGMVDVVRAETFRVRNLDYVKAAITMGMPNSKVIFRHVFPNAMVATLTFLPFTLIAAITALTSLDFLGFGLPAGSPSLGELLAQGKNNLHAPWLGITAFMSLLIMLTTLNFAGEAVRDALDPRKGG